MKDSNLHLLSSQRSTLELMEHINGNFPEGGLPTPIDCDLFSLVSAQNDQSFEPCRCFLIATHALSLLKGQDTENNPKWWTWWGSNPRPSACKADALPKLSYRPKYRTFNWPLPVNFVVTAASLNLYHFIRIGSLHSVHSGLCSLILRVIGPLH